MRDGAGARPRRRGRSAIIKALLTPPVPFVILGTVAAEVGLVLGSTALVRAWGGRAESSVTAFLLGVLVTAAFLVLSGVVAVFAGGVNWLTGATAERLTGRILKGLGPDWHLMHNVVFVGEARGRTWEYDIDHVAIGPGSVLVVESKYTSGDIDLDAPQLASKIRNDASQAARNAITIRRLLLGAGVDVPTTPLLVYWGFRLQMPRDAVTRLGRVHVVIGPDASRWARDVAVERAGAVALERAVAALQDHQREMRAAPRPAGHPPRIPFREESGSSAHPARKEVHGA